MLSQTSRPYIEASVPVLREHGLAITTRFYQSLFAAHPELKQIFNMGNQASGVQQQSLAAAVFAYAANIDNAAALGPVVERIVHKHVSIGVAPQHYPIVGQHLLAAIQFVLGEAATPALLAAWDEAYGLLAAQLIAAEARLYAQTGTTPGELRTLRVVDVQQESDDVVSYYLQTAEGASPGEFAPGQYVSIAVQLGDLRQIRQYSLSDAPQRPWWRISVKREDGNATTPSGQVSNWLHANIRKGDSLLVSAAFGDFRPALGGDAPITLLSAGVGITPMISVLNALAEQNPGRPLTFAHAARHGRHHALRRDIAVARSSHRALRDILFYETPNADDQLGSDYHYAGRMDMQKVVNAQSRQGDFYLCGPLGFMQQQWQALLAEGVSPARIHREVFGPELLDHLL